MRGLGAPSDCGGPFLRPSTRSHHALSLSLARSLTPKLAAAAGSGSMQGPPGVVKLQPAICAAPVPRVGASCILRISVSEFQRFLAGCHARLSGVCVGFERSGVCSPRGRGFGASDSIKVARLCGGRKVSGCGACLLLLLAPSLRGSSALSMHFPRVSSATVRAKRGGALSRDEPAGPRLSAEPVLSRWRASSNPKCLPTLNECVGWVYPI